MGEFHQRDGQPSPGTGSGETAGLPTCPDRSEIDAEWRRLEELARESNVRVFALAGPLSLGGNSFSMAKRLSSFSDCSGFDRERQLIDLYSRKAPEEVFEFAIESLGRSVDMMNEIVEETRRDHIEFEIRSRQIDRTLARTQEILDELLEEAQ
jgi:hypothetical protein